MASALTNRGSTRQWVRLRALHATTLPRDCPYCALPIQPWHRWDLDHATPRAHGGDDTHLRPAHQHCNRAAGATVRRHVATYVNPNW